MRYKSGCFYDANGVELGKMDSLPVNQDLVPKVYDGEKARVRSWIWDVALDKKQNPVLVYTTYPEDSKHHYNIARRDEEKGWINRQICHGGS